MTEGGRAEGEDVGSGGVATAAAVRLVYVTSRISLTTRVRVDAYRESAFVIAAWQLVAASARVVWLRRPKLFCLV